MKLKEEIKRVVVEYFAPIIWLVKLAVKLLEKAGLRCNSCGAWGRKNICFGSVIEELAPYPNRRYRMRVSYCPQCKSVSKAIKVYVPDYVEGMP